MRLSCRAISRASVVVRLLKAIKWLLLLLLHSACGTAVLRMVIVRGCGCCAIGAFLTEEKYKSLIKRHHCLKTKNYSNTDKYLYLRRQLVRWEVAYATVLTAFHH